MTNRKLWPIVALALSLGIASQAKADCAQPLLASLMDNPPVKEKIVAAIVQCRYGEQIILPRSETAFIASNCDANRPIVRDGAAVICTFRGWWKDGKLLQ